MPTLERDTTAVLTANGEGESAQLAIRGASDVSITYKLRDTDGNTYETDPESFPLADVAPSAATIAAIKATVLSELGVVASDANAIALSATAILRQRIDIRLHAAGLAKGGAFVVVP